MKKEEGFFCKKNRRGQILASNLIFIALNLIFLTLLVLFVVNRTGTDASVEEKYAKQIALMIDAAKPGMKIHLNMEEAIERAEKNGFANKIVLVKGNVVTVKLREKGGYSYSFFNDVNATAFKKDDKFYSIPINKYN